MTRINIIPPSNLSDELITAELGELPRIFSLVIKKIENNGEFNIPKKFSLGKGHVTFFYDKIEYLYDRYLELRTEYMLRKGDWYSVSHLLKVIKRRLCIKRFKRELYNNHSFTEEEMNILRKRITENIDGYKKPHHYYGKQLTKEEYKELIWA